MARELTCRGIDPIRRRALRLLAVGPLHAGMQIHVGTSLPPESQGSIDHHLPSESYTWNYHG